MREVSIIGQSQLNISYDEIVTRKVKSLKGT